MSTVEVMDSAPIKQLRAMLVGAGKTHFDGLHLWEECLCALILALEPRCNVYRILEALPYKNTPLDEADMLNIMAHLGYSCSFVKCDVHDMDSRLLPALFIDESKQVHIVFKGTEHQESLRCYEPESGNFISSDALDNTQGTLWLFRSYDEHAQPTSKFMRHGSGYSWFRALLGRFKGTFAQVLVAGLILNLITLATPVFIMIVYDKVIATGSISTLPMLAIGAVIAIAFEWKMRIIRSTGLSWLSGRLDNIVGNKIFSHLIGLSPSLIEKASIAGQLARIKTFESVRDFFSGASFLSLLEAPFIILSIIAVAAISGWLVLVPLAVGLVYAALFFFVRAQVRVSIRIAAKASSMRQQFVIETFEKLEGIRMHGLEDKWRSKFRHLSGREMMAHFRLSWIGMVAESCGHALTILAAVATIGFGVQRIWDGQMSTGALVATMMLVLRILAPFYALCTMVPRLEQLKNSIDQVNTLIDIDTEAEEAKSYSRLPTLKGAIVFDKVSFRYADDTDAVFNELSFEARAGDLVTITGSNGSGKASILKLIQSLHPCNSGAIRIDGFDIRQLDAPNLRNQIAYVPKVAHLFSGTLIENMRFANPLASESEVQQALEMADAWHDVKKLPDMIHTHIEELQLTSSMRTRLSLARAYLHTGSVLLIDELPNSLLSGKVGSNLKTYLQRAKGKKTVIFCTYREDFMKLSDTIIWLRGSTPPVVGARDKMLKKLSGDADHQKMLERVA